MIPGESNVASIDGRRRSGVIAAMSGRAKLLLSRPYFVLPRLNRLDRQANRGTGVDIPDHGD